MKVLFTAPVGERAYDEISKSILALGYEIDRIDELKEIEEMEYTDCDILICYDPFKKISFRKAKNLKAIITVSAGVDQIPQYLLDNEEIQIINNNGAYSIPIAEWIVMTILMGLKNYPAIVEKQREKKWVVERNTLECYEKKVLFLGAGKIATEAAKRLKPFNMETIAYRRSRKEHPDFNKTVYDEELNEELKLADVVVVCLPDTTATKKFVNADRIGMMRDDAIFINISRGIIVDEEALLNALDGGKFRFVALDVVEKEPLSSDSKLWDVDRLFLSTHTSWISQMRPYRMKKNVIASLKALKETGRLPKEINRRSKY